MGEDHAGKHLVSKSTQALTRRSEAYGQLANAYQENAADRDKLSDQAAQMNAAIEASRRQIAESAMAFKRELDNLPEKIKSEATERGKAFADDISEQAKTAFEEKIQKPTINWVKTNPWKAVGISFAIGFYIGMD